MLPAFLFVACSTNKTEDTKLVNELPFTKLQLDDLGAFQRADAVAWKIAGGIFFSRFDPNKIQQGEGRGVLYINNNSGNTAVLLTEFRHADMDVDLEFMTGKGSEASIWLQGRYKISLKDSWQQASPKSTDCGGSPVAGSDSLGMPLLNASKAPGLWQHLTVHFRAARFDAAGKKTSPAVFDKVTLNGKTVLENLTLPALSPGSFEKTEKGRASLAFLSSKGAIAFRNVMYKAYDPRNLTLSNMRFDIYKGLYKNYDTVKNFTPYKSGTTDSLTWRVGDKRAELKISGDMNIITAGDYLFRVRGGGAVALVVDEKLVVNNEGTREYTTAYTGSIKLTEGKHKFALFHANYDECLVIEYEGPGIPFTTLTTPASERKVKPPVPMELPVTGTPVMQRGFMIHQGKVNPYAVTVGFPNGISYAYDLTCFNLTGMWRGKYVDVSNMWEERGEAQLQIPLGANVEMDGLPALFNTDAAPETWPDSVIVDNNVFTERGYRIDSVNVPIYLYTYKGGKVEDRISSDKEGLIRRITYTKTTGEAQSSILLASGSFIEKLPDGSFAIDDKQFYIQFPDLESAGRAVITKFKNGRMGLLWKFKTDRASETITYSLIW